MELNDKIFVAGHTGLVGSAILRGLRAQNYANIVVRSHSELALDDNTAVENFFRQEKPEYVFLAAAKVGGIIANQTYKADFIRENLKIQTNVIDAAYRNACKKFVFLGSSCVYPKFAEQPIKESALLTGSLEPTNLPYAVAKIAGITMCDAYREQYGFNAFAVMPTNVYGVGDNFHPENSHVAAGLMRRFHEAKVAQEPEVVVWGSGSPLRELIDSDDAADAIIHLMKVYDAGGIVNVGSAQEISIRDLAELMKEVTGYRGEIKFDSSKPDGTPRKIVDNSQLEQMGWKAKTSLRAGLEKMYAWYLEHGAAQV